MIEDFDLSRGLAWCSNFARLRSSIKAKSRFVFVRLLGSGFASITVAGSTQKVVANSAA